MLEALAVAIAPRPRLIEATKKMKIALVEGTYVFFQPL
jgi:hypothetical protein